MECCAEQQGQAEDEVIAAARAAAIAIAIVALPASADDGLDAAWGPADNGLRIAIAATAHRDQHRGVTLELQLENTTDAPIRIPGRLRLPWNWHFEFEPEAGGSTLVAHFAHPPETPEPPEPIEVVAGERFVLRFDCRHWLHQSAQTIARPKAGRYRVGANPVPVGAELDPAAWTGNVRSGRIRVDIAFSDRMPSLDETESEAE
jgi:hypothetical protein